MLESFKRELLSLSKIYNLSGALSYQSHRVPLNPAKTITLDTLGATTTWKHKMFVMLVQDPDCHDSRALEACSLS